jgi:hypothetical protein
MGQITDLYQGLSRYALEPALTWVLDYPLVSVAVVILLIYWSVRGYRMM